MKSSRMNVQSRARSAAACKVCFDAGRFDICNTHKPRGLYCEELENAIVSLQWPVKRSIGAITLCPVLQSTICTNPQCFNGQDGVIRFPYAGHSISHCPCKWPESWEVGGKNEFMRFTGYSKYQWNEMRQQELWTNISNQR